MIGHNGSQHAFIVQLPALRHTRREDRISQVFRTLSTVLQSRKESRKRNLSFHLPAAIPLAPSLRLLELDNSYTSLQDVYDAHCQERHLSKEDPVLAFTNRFKSLFDPKTQAVGSPEYINLRVELMDEIETKYVPKTVLSDVRCAPSLLPSREITWLITPNVSPHHSQYMIRLMKTPTDLFLMRKQFTLQMASVTFITYVACLQQRTLPRFQFSRSTGMIYMSELLPCASSRLPVSLCTADSIAYDPHPRSSRIAFSHNQDGERTSLLQNDDPVDFRLTPNLQHFMTPTGIEGVLTASLVAIARGLCPPEVRPSGPTHSAAFSIGSPLTLRPSRHSLSSRSNCRCSSRTRSTTCRTSSSAGRSTTSASGS
jgi:transformation/transcription domain-associated protein